MQVQRRPREAAKEFPHPRRLSMLGHSWCSTVRPVAAPTPKSRSLRLQSSCCKLHPQNAKALQRSSAARCPDLRVVADRELATQALDDHFVADERVVQL